MSLNPPPSPADALLARAREGAGAEGAIYSRVLREQRRDLNVGATALLSVLALFAGLLGSAATASTQPEYTVPALVLTTLLYGVVAAYAYWRHQQHERASVSATEFYLKFEEILAQHQAELAGLERRLTADTGALNDDLRFWLQWQTVAGTIAGVVGDHIRRCRPKGGATSGEVTATCEAILSKLVAAREDCLRYEKGDDTYNIHVFRWDATAGHLTTATRKHGERIVPHGRTWREREGHAGHCFDVRKPILLPDLQDAEGSGYRNLHHDDDAVVYRAIIDIPIPGLDTLPWGVLTITSGRPNQFRETDFVPLTFVCEAIGIVVATQQ